MEDSYKKLWKFSRSRIGCFIPHTYLNRQRYTETERTSTMTSKERLLAAIERKEPDRLPVTTHHVMPWFLDRYMDGIPGDEFFEHFGLDPITWIIACRPDESAGDYYDPFHTGIGFLEARRVVSDDWRIESEDMGRRDHPTTRYRFVTPKKTLSMTLQGNDQTVWVSEHLVKEKSDIDVIGEYVTHPLCDVGEVNRRTDGYGGRGLARGHICCFDVFGQPGCWQDACCLAGTENMIMATFDDPLWVHEFLGILRDRKLAFIRSLEGARYDILELGGGDASTTVISPTLFGEFVAPYDAALIEAAHDSGQRIVYHTCGGMMPILEMIARRHGNLHPARHGGRCRSRGGETAHRKPRLHDRRIRPVSLFYGVHAGRDEKRGAAVFRGCRRGRRLHPQPVGPLLRRRGRPDPGLRGRGAGLRLLSGLKERAA